MSGQIFDDHPLKLVPLWCEALGRGWEAHFSRYKYIPQSVEDIRQPVRVKLRDVASGWLSAQLSELAQGEELAMHSLLTNGRRVRHIPMADFVAKPSERATVQAWMHEFLPREFVLFGTGNSFHAYGIQPVSGSGWLRLMGLLLLSNLPDKPPMADSRWIGHRLLAGYSSLRWSNNSGRYLKLPEQVQW